MSVYIFLLPLHFVAFHSHTFCNFLSISMVLALVVQVNTS